MDGRHTHENSVAIVGMAGRFPGAEDVREFWSNLAEGREALEFFTAEELKRAIAAHDYASVPHVSRQAKDPNFVNAGYCLRDIDKFDARFFGYSASEAELLDPQQRLFLETAWHALEDAGYDPARFQGSAGVFAGTTISRYFINNVNSNREIMYSTRDLSAGIGNEPDYLSNRVSYKLNLRGPSVSVQTACSTSLVAIHMACQSLLNGECDMALAGGAVVTVPDRFGYLYQEGSLASPDGRIRSFDAKAKGTVFSTGGVGAVVLKRMDEAVRDGDHIYASIRGSAVNNDGSFKTGYTAPGVEGQAKVVSEALAMAGVGADEISYVEAHGTGTPIGDPIEISALTRVYRRSTARTQYCAIGSVKPNIGHLAAAAGVASIIKTALALESRRLPPSLHFETPNPQIDFAASPFYVNTRLSEWKAAAGPRLAGVSSFGVGGTNAHAILEEAPQPPAVPASSGPQALLLSAKAGTALEAMARNLARHLESHPELDLADVAFTLEAGRARFDHRLVVVGSDRAGLAAQLVAPGKDSARGIAEGEAPVAFLFSGQGSQHIRMGAGLREALPAYREALDECVRLLKSSGGPDLDRVLGPVPGSEAEAESLLESTEWTQPALFAVEYALARQLMDLGVKPAAMAGHSLGEYVAACLAGVMSLGDALRIVAFRGKVMQSMPRGSMLSVSLGEVEIRPYLGPGISLAAINDPRTCVLSGETPAIESLERDLAAADVACRRLHTSHAFHSHMMGAALDGFRRFLEGFDLASPRLPYLSNVTGGWIADVPGGPDASYWCRHLRGTVRFRDGLGELLGSRRILLEVGPGTALSTFARRTAESAAKAVVVSSMRHPKDAASDHEAFLLALARLWAAGVPVAWERLPHPRPGRRVSLPGYPFERRRYWIEPRKSPEGADPAVIGRREDLADWFHAPSWRREPALELDWRSRCAGWREAGKAWLLFVPAEAEAATITRILAEAGQEVRIVLPAAAPRLAGRGPLAIRPGSREDAQSLLDILRASGLSVGAVLFAWNLGDAPTDADCGLGEVLELSFFAPLALLQALAGGESAQAAPFLALSEGIHDVTGRERLVPERAAVLGPVLCAPSEMGEVDCRSLDLLPGDLGNPDRAERILSEALLAEGDRVAALRGAHRWVRDYHPSRLGEAAPSPSSLVRAGDTVLITGGLGGMGLEMADALSRLHPVNLVLLGRSAFPARTEWTALAESADSSAKASAARRLLAMEVRGSRVLTLAADAADRASLAAAIANARKAFGAIQAVIHNAGVAGGGLIALKEREAAAKVLRPKILGTRHLVELLADDPPRALVLSSSLFAVTGGMGQVDYCAANNVLDAFARSTASFLPSTRVLSIGWDAWKDVGMAVNAVRAAARAPAAEPAFAKEMAHPLLGRRELAPAGEARYLSRFEGDGHWVLRDHRLGGNPVLPGTSYLEMARAAFADLTGTGADAAYRLEGIFFTRPFPVPEDGVRYVRILLKPADGGWEFQCHGLESPSAAEDASTLLAGGFIAALDSSLPVVDLEGLRSRYVAIASPAAAKEATGADAAGPGLVEFGPHWHNLRRIRVGDGEGLGELELPEDCRGDEGEYVLHPALLDMATGPITGHILPADRLGEGGGDFLPISYGSLKVASPLRGRLYSHVRLLEPPGTLGDTARFRIVVADADGKALAEIEDFVLKRVRPGAAPGAAPSTGSLPSFLEEAIAPSEGAEAFRRMLLKDRGQPHWVVTPHDLRETLRKARAGNGVGVAASGKETSGGHARPDLRTDYVGPRSQLEQALATIYQEALKLNRFGVLDNFFEAGGDSVMGIQIIAKAKRRGIAVQPQQIFKHQTVAELAEVLGGVLPAEAGAAPSEAPAAPVIEAPGTFPDADLSQDDLDVILKAVKG